MFHSLDSGPLVTNFKEVIWLSHLKRLSTLDSRWVVGAHNGLNAHSHPAWLTLYLAASKLLDLMLALPAHLLPQFQMYRWAFVGPMSPDIPEEDKVENNGGGHILKSYDFVPHISRIAKLMMQKNNTKSNGNDSVMDVIPHEPNHLLLTTSSISTLMDLQPFFNTLVSSSFYHGAADSQLIMKSPSANPSSTNHAQSNSNPSSLSGARVKSSNFSIVEKVIENDFLEPLPG